MPRSVTKSKTKGVQPNSPTQETGMDELETLFEDDTQAAFRSPAGYNAMENPLMNVNYNFPGNSHSFNHETCGHKRSRDNSLFFDNSCPHYDYNSSVAPLGFNNCQDVGEENHPIPSGADRGTNPVDPTVAPPTELNKVSSSKERKCIREKQRRAELSQAYTGLAKRLNLPPRTEKVQLIKSADSSISKLQKQVEQLRHQLTLVTMLPALKNVSKQGQRGDTCNHHHHHCRQCVPIQPRDTAHRSVSPRNERVNENVGTRSQENSCLSTSVKASPNVTPTKHAGPNALEEMRSLFARFEKIYKEQLKVDQQISARKKSKLENKSDQADFSFEA